MKTLLLMRHAKSDWDADYGADHERPLNDRGVRSAKIMGRVLSAEGRAPEHVITSTAVRARSTATLASEAGQWDCDIELEQSLYGGGADASVQAASKAPGVDRLMLVGHQPTWSILFSVLTGEDVEMKTATVAVVDFDISQWKELPAVRGSVSTVLQPRDFYDSEFDQV